MCYKMKRYKSEGLDINLLLEVSGGSSKEPSGSPIRPRLTENASSRSHGQSAEAKVRGTDWSPEIQWSQFFLQDQRVWV